MKKLTVAEITALTWQEMAKTLNERAEQILRETVEPETQVQWPDKWLTVKELAARWKMSENFIYAHADEWAFTVRRGRYLRFLLRGVEEHERKFEPNGRG